jgi:hypothetical protein
MDPMSRTPPKNSPSDSPEYVVRRETISRYFNPPLPRSTFHDLVNKGKVVPFKHLKGFYHLNGSLRRLGLPEVAELPKEPALRSSEDIVRLAFSVMDPDLFPAPSWLLDVEAIDSRDTDHAALLIEKHGVALATLDSDRLKHAYLQGTLDAHHLMKVEGEGEEPDVS